MKARIDSQGLLEILRKTRWETQLCPFSRKENRQQYCGDWCPLFYELERPDGNEVHLHCAPGLAYHEIVEDARAAKDGEG